MVRACTSLLNRASIGFHRRLGFSLVLGDGQLDGIPFIRDYNLPGDDIEAGRRVGLIPPAGGG